MKKIFTIITIILVGLILIGPNQESASASTKANTLAELRDELKAWKNKLASNEQKQKLTKEEIASAKASIVSKQTEIQKNRERITSAEKESQQLDIDIEEGKDSLANLIKTYQIAKADNVYLEYVFASTSYEDLVYRYAIIEQIMDYQEDKINEWKEKIEYNKKLKSDLESQEKKLDEQIDKLGEQIEDLNDALEGYFDTALDVKDDIKATEDLIKMYEDLGCGENENLESCVKVKGDTGFRKPFAHGTITSYFGYRVSPTTGKANEFHRGVDLAGQPEGTKIYSIANGIVAFVITKSSSSASCGGQRVYVHHLVNGKRYTSEYMHLLTINVKPGDVVTSDTVVGTMGGYSTMVSHGGYDRCTVGHHLHLGLGTGWYKGGDYTTQKQWWAHIVNPKDYLNLPNKGVYWGAR